ncbi:hypothetical protein [Polyangium jinanense]|uniref:Uncharacterized protein n=1 Tax=Polyangium jinanense TaxID=2829994 RepID=A0A9X3X2B6_9BACT|nr:hypothetical protein [Polyangium jinanense]MDC3956082.1 hypothetical protein [Polyangium jinanense]MDC3982887.1 hypothetical protein [Polyangium jinanense]
MKKLKAWVAEAFEFSVWVVEKVFFSVLVCVLVPILLAMLFAPCLGVVLACKRWVLDVPGGMSWYPTAFGGLFIGAYLFPISLAKGTFGRRLSLRVVRAREVPVDEALPHEFVAIDAWVVSGRPIERPAAPGGDEWVTYPLVLADASGGVLRVERADGADQPAGEGLHYYGAARVGHRVVALGEVRRDEVDGSLYRLPARGARLVRGKSPYFLVREGDLAAVVAEIRREETSPAWGIFSLVLLAVGFGSMIGAQSAVPSWFL